MIRREEVLPWFEELGEKSKSLPIEGFAAGGGTKAHQMQAFQAWMTEAETAIDGVFPPTHAIRTKWAKAEKSLEPFNNGAYVVGDAVIGVFQAALQLLREGRLGSLLDVVRVETESELLDQSQTLLDANHRAAATVIAGGVLEVHLRSLCDKLGLVITGGGSISKYDGAIAQARNLGTVTAYSVTDSKQVSVWGGMRNDAAHDPGAFSSSRDEVGRMIEGIREFIPRTN
jgi:hypothetical protein